MKATHRGHCQICGAQQKLPGGRLAKHGYSVEWNSFQGVCSGAGYLPFEQDISLIEAAIKHALERGAMLRDEAAKRAVMTDQNDVFDDVYGLPNVRGKLRLPGKVEQVSEYSHVFVCTWGQPSPSQAHLQPGDLGQYSQGSERTSSASAARSGKPCIQLCGMAKESYQGLETARTATHKGELKWN